MKTLIIHHVESMWNGSLLQYETSIGQMIENLSHHLDKHCYDKVILNRFEEWELELEHKPIAEHITEINPYGYGWTKDDFPEEEKYRYCEGGTHSEVVEIADWMHELSGEIYICGAFDGECIEDLEIALEHLNLKFNRIEHLIVG